MLRGIAFVPMRSAIFFHGGSRMTQPEPSQQPKQTQETIIPVVAEDLHIEKQRREAGQVVVHVVPHVKQQSVEVPVAEENVRVERVAINRQVAAPQPPRQEGDVTIVPIYEEILVVEKKLMLKEEVRITREKTVHTESQQVPLRSEEVRVLRSAPPPA
jgi:uncharacterized protein (TIGR02271 family)